MKDLYKGIGLECQTEDEGLIQRAISESKDRRRAVYAARQILLDPTRKEVYDRTHAVVSTIGQLRANLGLSRAPNWVASDCGDFDTSPSAVQSQLDALRSHAQSVTQNGCTKGSENRPGLFALGLLGVLVLLGFAVAFYNTHTSNFPYRRHPQPSYSSVRYESLVPSMRTGEERTEPVSAAGSSLQELAARTRQDRVRSLVRKRTERVGGVTDLVAVEALVQKLMSNQAEALPRTDVLSREFLGVGVAPLAIKTRGGSNYYVKLLDWTTKQEMLTAFIRGGERFETTLPLGSYEIRYAAGESWYGVILDFGDSASYSRCDERFDFTRTSDGYGGYTIELILQQDGNLKTEPISADDF